MISTRMVSTTTAGVLLACLLAVAQPSTVHAEPNVITTEATYMMGDGETPSFAEAMVLQKAKGLALEEAGTYVESYAKVKNGDLTHEEIQTIAGGVLEVEVLKRNRTLVGDGLRFFIKIKATVTTQRLTELTQRIKANKDLTEEHRSLQKQYEQLYQQVELLKDLIVKTPDGGNRERLREQFRSAEKDLTSVQTSEQAFFKRLVSGEELVSNALNKPLESQPQRSPLDILFEEILQTGIIVKIGEPDSTRSSVEQGKVEISVPITLTATDKIKASIYSTAKTLKGEIRKATYDSADDEITGKLVKLAYNNESAGRFWARVRNLVLRIEFEFSDGKQQGCYVSTSFRHYGSDLYPIQTVSAWMFNKILHLENADSANTRKPNSLDEFILVHEHPSMFRIKRLFPYEEMERIKSIVGQVKEINIRSISMDEDCKTGRM